MRRVLGMRRVHVMRAPRALGLGCPYVCQVGGEAERLRGLELYGLSAERQPYSRERQRRGERGSLSSWPPAVIATSVAGS